MDIIASGELRRSRTIMNLSLRGTNDADMQQANPPLQGRKRVWLESRPDAPDAIAFVAFGHGARHFRLTLLLSCFFPSINPKLHCYLLEIFAVNIWNFTVGHTCIFVGYHGFYRFTFRVDLKLI